MKKKPKKKRRVRLRCDRCHHRVKEGPFGSHDSALSTNHVTWDGVAIVAWCQYCGWEYASDH